ncbi:MAG TPA: hypothetical protein VNP92_18090 [Actinophytocola sp.]|nr:hypothetical protein [Actinophytocola sp.]
MTASLFFRFLHPPRLMRMSWLRQETIRLMRVQPVFPQIEFRPFSTDGGRRRYQLAELITTTASQLWQYLPANFLTGQQTATPPTPTPPPKQTPPKPPADPWADEGSWVAIDKDGFEGRPSTCPRLFRSHSEPPEKEFRDGMPAPGTDFRLKQHQGRTTDRDGTNDAFYGTSHMAAWDQTEGPAFDMTNRYMSVLVDAYGFGLSNQLGKISVVEMETVVHKVPPHKIVAEFDKFTGKIWINPTCPKALAAEVTAFLERIWEIGLARGIYTKQ